MCISYCCSNRILCGCHRRLTSSTDWRDVNEQHESSLKTGRRYFCIAHCLYDTERDKDRARYSARAESRDEPSRAEPSRAERFFSNYTSTYLYSRLLTIIVAKQHQFWRFSSRVVLFFFQSFDVYINSHLQQLETLPSRVRRAAAERWWWSRDVKIVCLAGADLDEV